MKYDVIYADPPWTYNDKSPGGNKGASHYYPVMSIDRLKLMPIDKITTNDSCLFMWSTFPLIQEGLDLIKSWGFTYKTVAFNWIKTNKKNHLTPFFGMGNWTRSNSEVCLLGIKGKPKRKDAGVSQLISSDFESEDLISPLRQHSQKPDEVYEKIERLTGSETTKLELFSRSNREGWSCWGNDTHSINIPELEDFFRSRQ